MCKLYAKIKHMNIIARIHLVNIADEALPFIRKAMANHIQDVEIIEKNGDYDLSVSLPHSIQKPMRIGTVFDRIEKVLFENNYNTDVVYKHYHLNMRDNSFKIDQISHALSVRETELCAHLLKAGEKGCSRESLLKNVWGYRSDLETHALETQIYRLRQKIEKTPDSPQIIVTIEGGYKFS